jgi:hypothetical protein
MDLSLAYLKILAEKEAKLEIDRKIKIWIAQADAWLGKELNNELIEKLLLSVKKSKNLVVCKDANDLFDKLGI